MSLISYLLAMLVIGLLLGGLARLALPGRDPMSIPQTIAIGIAGSFIGGIISLALFGRSGGGLFIPFVCSFLIVYAIRRHRGGGLMDPGGRRDPLRRY
jgi:uncharacterized membrane protein YeaQ/YmgE (transglycosylase-associated protein family)